MTQKFALSSFCSDNRVVTVMCFKNDRSVHVVSCHNQEKCYGEDVIVASDIVLIARLMSGGAIDYPYASSTVMFRQSTTTIEVTTEDSIRQEATVKNIIKVTAVNAGKQDETDEDNKAVSKEGAGKQEMTSNKVLEEISQAIEVSLPDCYGVGINDCKWDTWDNRTCETCRKVDEFNTEHCYVECWTW